MQTEIIQTETTETPDTVAITRADGQTQRVLTLLPQYAQTPKRGAARTKREPQLLLAYLLTHGTTLHLTPETYAALEADGLPKHRVVNAVSDLKKYFGVPVASSRTGRKVTSYTFTL